MKSLQKVLQMRMGVLQKKYCKTLDRESFFKLELFEELMKAWNGFTLMRRKLVNHKLCKSKDYVT